MAVEELKVSLVGVVRVGTSLGRVVDWEEDCAGAVERRCRDSGLKQPRSIPRRGLLDLTVDQGEPYDPLPVAVAGLDREPDTYSSPSLPTNQCTVDPEVSTRTSRSNRYGTRIQIRLVRPSSSVDCSVA